MVDGVLVLVDAAEGPMPQTKFVTAQGAEAGPQARSSSSTRWTGPTPARTRSTTRCSTCSRRSTPPTTQLDFPTLYASGRNGWAVADLEKDERKDLTPLFELIVKHVAAAQGRHGEARSRMLATILEYDPYLGRVLTGRIESGVARVNMPVKSLSPDGRVIEDARLTKLLAFRGLDRRPIEEAQAGDIIAIAGLTTTTVADTIGAADRRPSRCTPFRSIRRPWR